MSEAVSARVLKVLSLIGEQATKVSDIAKRAKLSPQDVIKICRPLVKKGLLSMKSGMVRWTSRGQEWWPNLARQRERLKPEAAAVLTELEKHEAEFVNVGMFDVSTNPDQIAKRLGIQKLIRRNYSRSLPSPDGSSAFWAKMGRLLGIEAGLQRLADWFS